MRLWLGVIFLFRLGHGAGVCTLTPSCDEWSPCCNTAGWCGASYGFCGAGCHEEGNFNSTRCLPKPACSDGTFKVSTDRIAEEVGFNGDYINRDFTVQGEYSIEGEGILLKLSKPGTGTVLRSTRYINFGRISADLSMKRVGGVVTSFITMADNKDEVDFEFVGNGEIQSNWYYRGIVPEYKDNHQKIISLPTTTHNYAIDLTQDAITWLIDGIPVRTLPRKDDQFPSTPTRFSFSIWDGSSGEAGTREWAGGMVNWDLIKPSGAFTLTVTNIKVQCYGPPTSKDDDFELDSELGLILRGKKPISSSHSKRKNNHNAPFNLMQNHATFTRPPLFIALALTSIYSIYQLFHPTPI